MVAVADEDAHLTACLESLERHTPSGIPLVRVEPSTAEVNRALEEAAPADVVILDQPCSVTPGWLERLRDAARVETNTATVSTLSDAGPLLGLADEDERPGDLADLAAELAANTLRLRPRLGRAMGPCVYVRREALELVGELDETLALIWALEVDFAQRCLRSGLAHLAADDVLVGRLGPTSPLTDELPAALLGRYPELPALVSPMRSEASVLGRALEAVRAPRRRLWVTLDARALDGALTGTQVNIVELILALARTGRLRLRLLVRPARIDRETLALLRALPATEILSEQEIDEDTPASPVFHRPHQTFAPEDVSLALALGERMVLSQLDLIAYRNPGYFPGAEAWEAYRRASRHGLSAAERVVVFSDHTRRELLSDALVEDARIRIVPPGLDHRPAGEPRRPEALGLSGTIFAEDFLLCLGTDFTHKNRVFALRLLGSLRERHDWQGKLVLAGTHIPDGSSRQLERSFLEQYPQLNDAICAIGAVTEQEKAWLLAHASAVVYPSAFEGFGLVPFESALNGVPCVFAAQSSLAEAAPQDAATITPWDPALSADAAFALLTDPSVRAAHLAVLADAARKLTWDSTAAAMVQIYREAAVAPVRDAATLSRDAFERERELSRAHQEIVDRLIGERRHAQRMYEDLNAEVGAGLSLIGPNGTLPENLQRALLTVSARPALSRPLYGALSSAFALARGLGRALSGARRRSP